MKNSWHIGCSGFSERLWKGCFYPENLKSSEYLEYYSSRVNAVEINSTFYHRPTLKTLEKWKNSTPKDFGFFIKIPKQITHFQKLTNSKAEIDEFCQYIAENLGNKLRGFLFQMPPSFHNTEENIQKIIDNIDAKFLTVIEFRHKSWWEEKIFSILAKRHIIFSGVSIPKDIPENVIINNKNAMYFRLHGKPKMFSSSYSHEYLENLFSEISQFQGEKYIFFNNTYGTAGIENALFLQSLTE